MITIDRKALKAVSRFQAIKDIRYYLNGVYVESSPLETRLVATDGHTLAAHRMTIQDTNTGTHNLIIPTATVKAVLSWKVTNKYLPDVAMLTIGETECRIEAFGQIAVFKPVDGNFPDYRKVIPTSISGEPGQYNPVYLERCQQSAQDLKGSGIAYISIGYNGDNGAAIVRCGTPDFVAVVMTLRSDAVNVADFAWARGNLPQPKPETVTAECGEAIAEMIDPDGDLQAAGLLRVVA